jgi:hypothetical protein
MARSSFDRTSARGVVIPDWLRQDANRELADPAFHEGVTEAETAKTK